LHSLSVTGISPKRTSAECLTVLPARKSPDSDDCSTILHNHSSSANYGRNKKPLSIKITSIPVSGGNINISYDPSSIAGTSGQLTCMPTIKSEPAN